MTTGRFALGRLMVTREVGARIPFNEIVACLERHEGGDWGDLSTDDLDANDAALVEGSRLLSAYQTSAGKVWVITEADRSATTVLFPHEY